MSKTKNGTSSLSGVSRFVIRHQSLVLAVVVAAACFAFLTSGQFTAQNLLISWDLGALVYLALSWYRMMTSEVHLIRKRAADLDFSDSLLLLLASVAALASIAGIAMELRNVQGSAPDVALAKACMVTVTILISWVFLHTLFTIHYAHRYYAGEGKGGGLHFPDDPEEPVYWDFLYYSFTIGVAAQTADIEVTSTLMRKLTLAHSVLSFLFNTTIVALAINVGASLLQG